MKINNPFTLFIVLVVLLLLNFSTPKTILKGSSRSNAKSYLRNFAYLSSKIIEYNKIKECNEIAENPEMLNSYFSKYKEVSQEKSCNYIDVFAYTTNYFKPINCFLRTNLGTKIAIPKQLTSSISLIQASLKSTRQDGILSSLAIDQKVYRGTHIADPSLVKKGKFFKNLSFLSTSTDEQSNSAFKNTINKYSLTLVPQKGKALAGKILNSCSANKQENEALLIKNLCWEIIHSLEKEVTMQNVDCRFDVTYGDL